jgi:hypothetical protein
MGAIVAIAALAALGSIPAAAEAATTHASPIARAAAIHSSAKAAPDASAETCSDFALAANYYGTWLYNVAGLLSFNTSNADELCQAVVSGSNVVIYDLAYGNGDSCLAYSSASKHVYLHANCPVSGAPSYEQWKFLPLGGELYMLENGYEINGGYYCMEEDGGNAPPMGVCSAENHQAVMYYEAL